MSVEDHGRRKGARHDMKRIFYGWYMVVAGCGLQFLQAALLMQSFGAYVAVLRDDRGWSKTALSGAAALHQMEAAILGPVLGWIIDRSGPQGLIRIGVVVFGIGFMLFSQVETLLEFYGAFIVMAIGSRLCRLFPAPLALRPLRSAVGGQRPLRPAAHRVPRGRRLPRDRPAARLDHPPPARGPRRDDRWCASVALSG